MTKFAKFTSWSMTILIQASVFIYLLSTVDLRRARQVVVLRGFSLFQVQFFGDLARHELSVFDRYQTALAPGQFGVWRSECSVGRKCLQPSSCAVFQSAEDASELSQDYRHRRIEPNFTRIHGAQNGFRAIRLLVLYLARNPNISEDNSLAIRSYQC